MPPKKATTPKTRASVSKTKGGDSARQDIGSDEADDPVPADVPVEQTPPERGAIFLEVENMMRDMQLQYEEHTAQMKQSFASALLQWKGKFDDMARQLETKDEEINALKAEIKKLEEALSKDNSKTEIQKLKKQLKTKNNELQEKETERADMETKLKAAEAKLRKSEQEKNKAVADSAHERAERRLLARKLNPGQNPDTKH